MVTVLVNRSCPMTKQSPRLNIHTYVQIQTLSAEQHMNERCVGKVTHVSPWLLLLVFSSRGSSLKFLSSLILLLVLVLIFCIRMVIIVNLYTRFKYF